MTKLIPAVLVLMLFASCDIMNMRRERGNGHVQTDTRRETNFKGVESFGSFDVYVTTDNSYAVKIEAEENLLHYIQTSVENGNLRISTKHGVSIDPTKPMKVYVSAPVFNRLTTSGSGNLETQNKIVSNGNLHIGIAGSGNIKADVKADEVSSDISGSGDITLSGNAVKLGISIAGDGDVKAAGLHTDEVTINVSGSGDAVVDAAKKLDVHIAGSGDVKYTGNPDVSQHIVGSGSITKLN